MSCKKYGKSFVEHELGVRQRTSSPPRPRRDGRTAARPGASRVFSGWTRLLEFRDESGVAGSSRRRSPFALPDRQTGHHR